jgi:TetR/AcrR family transcriptional repressor of mexCD-oprJ operon
VAQGMQEGTRREIISAAASVLAARQGASMADVAAAAGIARATLYRYFPSRETLLRELEAAANEQAGRRLGEASLDEVPVEEAVARATRALVAVGSDFIVLLRERRPPEPSFSAPLTALIERGRKSGQLCNDVPVACLVESLLALIGACVRTGQAAGMGAEDISSTALRLFLNGARPPLEDSR